MPVMTDVMKKLFNPLFDRRPVILNSVAGDKADALLSSDASCLTFDVLEEFSAPLASLITVSDRDSGAELMRFESPVGIVVVRGQLILKVEMDFACMAPPVKAEPIFLKGDGDNPDILVI